MNSSINSLSPAAVWSRFDALSKIPRPSKSEDLAIQWAAELGAKIGCEVELQRVGTEDRPYFANLLLRKAASPGKEHIPCCAFQAHIDMVGTKEKGSTHDFSRDAIQMELDGDYVSAKGTTLGADNGIGLCVALAILGDESLMHGPLELLITVDEEKGMSGVKALRSGWLKADFMINVDSEADGEATVASAGSQTTTGTWKLQRTKSPDHSTSFRLGVAKLPGGHSGLEIATGSANAIKMLAVLLQEASAQWPICLSGITGGNAPNAIPAEAEAILTCARDCYAPMTEWLSSKEEALRKEWAAQNPKNANLTVSFEEVESKEFVMSQANAATLLQTLRDLPHGVESMSENVKGLVETSTNLAQIFTGESSVEIVLYTRSSVDEKKAALTAKIGAILRRNGLESRDGDSTPGWWSSSDSEIARRLDQSYEAVLGTGLKFSECHAGLECGLLAQYYPGLQIASVGPSIYDAHTPKERVSVSSVERFWKVLRHFVEQLAQDAGSPAKATAESTES